MVVLCCNIPVYACHFVYSQSMEPNVGSKSFWAKKGSSHSKRFGEISTNYRKRCYGHISKQLYVTVTCVVIRKIYNGKQKVKFC